MTQFELIFLATFTRILISKGFEHQIFFQGDLEANQKQMTYNGISDCNTHNLKNSDLIGENNIHLFK